ncbi:MAG: CHC2 zinc finger domain-containing protein [Planctomycetota bacterium]
MPKIPEETIQRIKQEISLKDFIESTGVKLRHSGNSYLGLCQFHNDTKPSLSIEPQRNLWCCHGACDRGGSIIDYVMELHKVKFPQAVEILLEKHPEITNNHLPVKNRPPKNTPRDFTAEDYEVLQQVNDYYHSTLKKTKKAIDYLKKRGITNNETILNFKIGFSDRTLGLKTPKERKAKNLRDRLTLLGIFRETGHEHFVGSITIPIMDRQGKITEMYGRKITKHLREGTPLHLYLSGPHKGIFNPQALNFEEIILCESLIDALTFWDKGLRNVTSSYGANGFTQEMLEAFLENNIRKVYICYDNDRAGNSAAETLAKKLISHKIEACRAVLPEGMDINEFSMQTPGKEVLEYLLKNAKSMGKVIPSFTAQSVPEKKEEEAVKEKNDDPPLIPKSLDVSARVMPEQIDIKIDDRHYRIRGFEKNLSFDNMRINLQVFRGERFHVDSLNLYNFIQRKAYIKIASLELAVNPEIIKRDVGRVLPKLEQLQVKQIRGKMEPKKEKVVLSAQEENEATAFLKSPDLIETIKQDFYKCGLVGEQHNSLVAYIALTSRKLGNPLAVIVQSL